MGVTGQGDGTWLVDGNGRPVRPAILWSDGRTAAFVQDAYRSGLSAEIFQITGTALNTCNQGFHLRWLQENEPAALARTAAVLRAKDWIFLKLTGVVSTDETDASHTFFSIHDAPLRRAHLCAAGHRVLAQQDPAGAAAGAAPRRRLLPAVAAELGLRPGTPITAGPFDVAASALGAGAIAPGDACCVMGTAGINQVIADRPVMEPANLGYNICYVPQGNYLRLLPTMTNTPNLQWFVREFFAAERQAAEADGSNVWDELERLAGTVPLGSYGVMYHPYIDPAGERSPFVCSSARAQFTGLSIQHGRHVMLPRRLRRRCALAARLLRHDGRPGHRTAPGRRRRPQRALGADSRRRPWLPASWWPTARNMGPKAPSSMPASLLACTPSYADGVARTVRAARHFAPDPARREDYAVLLQVYRSVREAMLPVWEQRARLLQRFTESI